MQTHRTHAEIVAEMWRLSADLGHHIANAAEAGEDAVRDADAAALGFLARARLAADHAREALED